MTTATKSLAAHGTLSRHKHYGCTCNPCKDAYRTYQNRRYRQLAYGTWQPYVDAEPVRQHLLALRAAGISYQKVAEAAGLYPASVGAFIYSVGGNPPRARTRHETAQKILAVRASDITPHMIPSTGTRRRLQALAASGWPLQAIAPHIGRPAKSVGRILGQEYVFASTAEATAAAYQRLRDDDPTKYGVPAWSADRTRRNAALKGWAGPDYWDDDTIDDPTFVPALTEPELNRDELAARRREEVAHLAFCGLTPEEIHGRVDLSLSTVRQLVLDWRTGQKRDRRTAAA